MTDDPTPTPDLLPPELTAERCPCIASKNPVVQPTSRSRECPRGPVATRRGLGGYTGNCVTNFRYSVAYSAGVMSPPQPHDSLPTPHQLTPNGPLSPFAARSAASVVVPAGALQ